MRVLTFESGLFLHQRLRMTIGMFIWLSERIIYVTAGCPVKTMETAAEDIIQVLRIRKNLRLRY